MKLDTETSRRLSLDAALGQLPPDVQALWEAYLAGRPELAEAARLDRQTVLLARQALSADAPAEPLKLPNRPAMPTPSPIRPSGVAKWAGAIAAGLVIGLALGLHVSPGPATPPGRDSQSGTSTVQVGAPPTPSAAGQDDNRFWSTKRLYRQLAERRKDQSSTPTRAAGGITWESPVKPEVSGDAL